ncbi:ABC transporter ATP-binding protein [Romboutsia lituseburensis]|uniref:ABC-2 type transport system ATP-binding protein n=1 Tax=Romboutsia lituseburensis DSM 797 TaxID=1121325 RepID=A0A1G9ILQ0_9FIRM|nr:ABC transporter ATP-binding protein [Romboutsia lituseburensis]CEH33839.1 ABC super ATP binding cassette transporter domain protein [Romboutsia lituseburensis]SDL26188.1 ABC-2 type transport system ATP-binding protein [Romboutsia lituseburensis DSM 797]
MIEVKNVSKRYRKVKALDDISFTIEEGKITCILGINGVGKSTILKAISGLVRLDSGDILIDGEKLTYNTYNKLAFVPDIDIHFPQMTIKESFEFMKDFYKNWNEEKAYEMLKMFDLTDDRRICKLSKGNKARVKIILGFAQDAKYILLDEPFSGIDIFKREEFIGIMAKYMSDEQSIVITTHEIAEIQMIVDDVILINNGKLVEKFNAEELREKEGMSIIDKMREVYKGE